MAITVTLRAMRPEEYDDYLAERDAEYTASLSDALPADAARKKSRQDLARFLPEGLATEGHRLLVAEDAGGDVIGNAWLGLTEPGTGTPEVAWLYDIKVLPAHRRQGYARAILVEVEQIAREAGAHRLGLNVFGGNAAAIALYTSSGYTVTTQQMAKPLR